MKTIFASALVMLLLAGCGNSDSESSDSSTSTGSDSGASTNAKIVVASNSLTKAEFIRKADLLCERQGARFAETFQRVLPEGLEALPSVGRPEAEAIVNEGYVPTRAQVVEEVSALGAPKGDEQAITELLEAIQAGAAEAASDPMKFAHNTKAAFPSVAKAERLGIAYGMRVCGFG